MLIKRFVTDFIIYLCLTFIVAAIASYLYNLIAHGQGVIDWDNSIRIAIILSLILPIHNILSKK